MEKQIISQFEINDMRLYYVAEESGAVGMLLIPSGYEDRVIWSKEYKIEPLIQVKLAADSYPFGFSQGRTMRNSASTTALHYEGQKASDGEIVTELTDCRGYHYFHHICWHKGLSALECYTVMENRSKEAVRLEMISSFTLGGMTPFTDRIAEETMVLHQIRSTWSAEGRLVSNPLEELQLEPSWQNYSANSLRFGEVGSMPVRGYFPFVAVEDQKSGVVWAAELSHGSSWQLEAYRRDDALVISGGICDREFGQWMKILNPGEVFETPKAVLTVAAGDVSHTAQRLVENIRPYLDIPESEQSLPVLFNEFCTTWGCPEEEKIKKMAEILKGKGLTYFVIDAGWFDSESFDVRVDIGEWNYNPERFRHGMKETADFIKSCNLIPGIWFEFEISGADSVTFNWAEHLLKRDGIPITSGKRRFFDMRQEWVQEYLAEKVIDFLRDNGFGYVKVDYNETIGIGCDGDDSLGEGLRQQILGTQKFFKRIHRELPEVVIENCSSGGHRLVPSFMELVSMASFSDAHECDEIPIIAANMHRMILPSQSQIWAVLRAENPPAKFYYQLSSTLLGRCCISGDIENLNDSQWAVVENGFAFYRAAAPVIACGETLYYGSPIKSYRKPKGWQGIVRMEKSGEHLLAVVHTFHDADSAVQIPVGEDVLIEQIFCRPGISVKMQNGFLILEGLEDFDGAGVLLKKNKR